MSYAQSPGPDYVLNERGEWVRSNQFNPLSDGFRLVHHQASSFSTRLLAGAEDTVYDAVSSSTRADAVSGFSIFVPWGAISGGSATIAYIEPSPGASLLPLRENSFYRVRVSQPRVHVFFRHGGSVAGNIGGAVYYVGQTGSATFEDRSPLTDFILRQTVTVAVPASGTATLVNEMGMTGTGITPRVSSLLTQYWDFGAERIITGIDCVASGAGTVNGAYIVLNNVAYGAPASTVSLNAALQTFQGGVGILGTSTPDAVGGVPGNTSAFAIGGSAGGVFPVGGEGLVIPLLSYNTAGGAVTFSITVRGRGRIPGFAPLQYFWNLPPV